MHVFSSSLTLRRFHEFVKLDNNSLIKKAITNAVMAFLIKTGYFL